MPTIPWHPVEKLRGSCLCGEVSYEITSAVTPIGQCHCSLCRKVSGTGATTTLYARSDGFRFTSGESLVKSFSKPSGYTSTFCSRCGSPLPHAAKGTDFHFVPAGTLDGDPGTRGIALHIYVGSKAPWEVIADDAPQLPEAMQWDRPG